MVCNLHDRNVTEDVAAIKEFENTLFDILKNKMGPTSINDEVFADLFNAPAPASLPPMAVAKIKLMVSVALLNVTSNPVGELLINQVLDSYENRICDLLNNKTKVKAKTANLLESLSQTLEEVKRLRNELN